MTCVAEDRNPLLRAVRGLVSVGILARSPVCLEVVAEESLK